MWGHMKKADTYKWGRRLSPETETASTLMLSSPTSRTVRNEYLLFGPLSLWWFYYSSPCGLRQAIVPARPERLTVTTCTLESRRVRQRCGKRRRQETWGRDGAQRDSRCEKDSSLLALKMEGFTSQWMWVALEAEYDRWSTTSKEMRTRSYYHMELDSANNLIEPGSGFSLRASNLADTVISAEALSPSGHGTHRAMW